MKAELNVVKFDVADVITASNGGVASCSIPGQTNECATDGF